MAYQPNNPNGQATGANSGPVVIASDQSQIPVHGNIAAAATDTGNPLKVGTKYNATPPTYTDGQRTEFQVNNRGTLAVELKNGSTQAAYSTDNADAVGASSTADRLIMVARNYIFNGSTYDRTRTAVGAVAAGTGTQGVAIVPAATALGLTSFQNTAVAATSVTVKASAGRLHRITIQNPNTALAWLQIFNTTAPTIGTTAPVMSIPIPASGIFEDFYPMSDTFSTAIAIAATTTPTGSTANTTALFVSLGFI